ncbi:MAG: 4Fe-4S dicluster domain-containing protein [Gemmataceae bacterium]
MTGGPTYLLPTGELDRLIALLAGDGYQVIGPRIDQAAIVYAPIESSRDLPRGWTDRQEPGSYRLEQRDDDAYFGYAVGPHSWKKFLFPPVTRLWHGQRTASGFDVRAEEHDPPRRALLGLRSCELHALAIQDRVFIGREGRFTDPHYALARERLFLVAVECETPAGTCFCASMETGPEVEPDRIATRNNGAGTEASSAAGGRIPLPEAPPPELPHAWPVCDLVLTELADAFVVRAASEAGVRVVARLQLGPATAEQESSARERVAAARKAMGRSLDTSNIRELLQTNQEHRRWDEVADRCLACTNCTLVCPTCFCSCTEDVADLSLENVERVRRWDSCFNPEFGRVHGGNFRPSVRARYRQWLTHKFASWFDQFGTSGCVGCGRCITWCPVGIDVTEEIQAIRTTG